MPELCRFYGIIISMYYADQSPPHFHARYGEASATIRMDDLAVLDGALPGRALGLVVEWAGAHREELSANWALAQAGKPINKIPPLM